MSLTSCPTCGHQVSNAATACPSCGHPLKAPGEPTLPGWYKDPKGEKSHEAYWDGEAWTGEVRRPTDGADAVPATDPARWLLMVAGAITALGSFLPWAQAGIFSLAGTDGDGVLTLIAGILIVAIGFVKRSTVIPGIAALGLSVFSLWVVGSVFSNFETTPENLGAGLFVTGLGAFIGLFGGIRAIGHRTA